MALHYRQNHSFLKDVAHPSYVNGLQSSGINIDAIPKVEEMNDCLAPSGWGAVTIDGLIPGVAFFDFQGHGLLPIATDIRKVENMSIHPLLISFMKLQATHRFCLILHMQNM